ncbi:nuclear transport factor 2 family protein [Streptomyces sp. NPDC091292]|uniref:nuclear transport factor 2 family protein n=1 Tax=Streptomyces sp. NPDC091292 TaxID=3365991 RepID=UPI0038064B59
MADQRPDGDLRELAARYAHAVDRRDREAFLSVFHPEATLVVVPPSGAVRRMRGYEQLGLVTERIARYDRTFHLLGQSIHSADGADEASGVTYCVAHHMSGGADPVDHVMYIRYQDRFRRDSSGWTIDHREVLIDWTETRPVDIVREASHG